MAISTFDTHKFVRRLEEAGVPLAQAEVQAEVLTEAFNVNLESLVTKDFSAARFAEQTIANAAVVVQQNLTGFGESDCGVVVVSALMQVHRPGLRNHV